MGVSCDSRFSLAAWKQAMGYTARLVSDFWPHGDIGRLYEAFDERLGLDVRKTFFVDEEGVVRDVVSSPELREARDIDSYLKSLSEM